MENPLLRHEGLKRFRQIFLGDITPQCLNINMKLSLNFSTKGTKMRKKLITTFLLIKPSDVREIVDKSNEILKPMGDITRQGPQISK